jgi:hypothetical protein
LSTINQADCLNQSFVSNKACLRWHQHNLAVKNKSRIKTLETKTRPEFEAVTLARQSVAPKRVSNAIALTIHLPNQIRCDVAIDLDTNEFSTLL